MKKDTIIGIILSVLALIALGLLVIYLTTQHLDVLFPSEDTLAEKNAEAVILALHESDKVSESETNVPEQPQTNQTELSASGIFTIWVGDSRTIGMRDAVKNDDVYIGASGEGYDWLSATGLPLLKKAIKDYPDAPVVFNFGVNDYDNMENYLSLYTSLLDEYKDTHFYFLSVNPIDPDICKNITNEEITDFNNHLKNTFGSAYIDSYSYLLMKEAGTIDGVHYSGDNYRLIHTFAAREIANLETEKPATR